MKGSVIERVREYMDAQGIKSAEEFATKIGISPSTLRCHLNGNRALSLDAVIKIVSANASLSCKWLLKGEGAMIVSADGAEGGDSALSCKLVPLIHIDSVGGVFSENAVTDSPEYVERFVPFNGAQEGDLAIYQSGDSMLPMIPSGAVLQIREVKRWREYFGFGDVFVLVLTDGRRITKKVTKCEGDDDFVLCVSFNEAYPPERLPRDMIVSVWKVIKVLNNIGW